jgi:hypothetical protein
MSAFASSKPMGGRLLSLTLAVAAMALASLAWCAHAAAAPRWQLFSTANSQVAPGEKLIFFVDLRNKADAPDGSPVTLRVHMPGGFSLIEAKPVAYPGTFDCSAVVAGTGDTCQLGGDPTADVVNLSTEVFTVLVQPGTGGILTASFEVAGGGGSAVQTVDPTLVTPAPAVFGLDAFDGQLRNATGGTYTQAGGHPYSYETKVSFNTRTEPRVVANPPSESVAVENATASVSPVKDVVVELPPGLVGNPTVAAQCTIAQLAHTINQEERPLCPPESQVGTIFNYADLFGSRAYGPTPIFNMVPPPGIPARFGFQVTGVVITLDVHVLDNGNVLAVDTPDIPAAVRVSGTEPTFWGTPVDSSHDDERTCPGSIFSSKETCASNAAHLPFMRMPTSCEGPVKTTAYIDSWADPGTFDPDGRPNLSDPAWKTKTYEEHQLPGYPANPEDPGTPWGPPQGQTDCSLVPVKGELSAQPTAHEVETSSGLSVSVHVPNPGLENPDGISSSDIEAVKVALPQGMTINPSQAEGLGVCSPAQYESPELSFYPNGSGCPSDSKIGTVEVHTPLLEEAIPGNVYVAEPYDNPFGSLLALYIVLEEPQRGILIKLPGEIHLNETTGRIETTFENLPQVPFSTFEFHFREGARAPLVTPPTCGTYTTETEFTPWSDPARKLTSDSSFEITSGIGGGACPPNGTPPFKPGFEAGSINNAAASYTPFYMRLMRNDGEQDMTRFSATLPPGVLGRLAGISKCPDSAIGDAKAKSGIEEREHPSCPSGSEIGRTMVGAGVGSVLTHIPGKIYLGGPYHGDPLSVIAITPAVAGPFDVGDVVVQQALTLNPKTAEVEVDGSASDPIPHILKGIPAKVRDIRVYVDRPDFILNPTSCERFATDTTLVGSGANPFDNLDDVPVGLTDRFQAADCAALPFKPHLGLHLTGGTKRGAWPGLKAVYTPRKGDANVKGLVVRLSRSAFLEQGHIRTICTRVQYAAENCPKAAQYGYVKAWTPLLEEPLQGPVWLRSSNHKLPDLVFDLRGLVNVEVDTRIDSFKGGIRATVENAPDALISRVLLRMQGGKKGLIVNSRGLCAHRSRASVQGTGQNGKRFTAHPKMAVSCRRRKPRRTGRHSHTRHRHRYRQKAR